LVVRAKWSSTLDKGAITSKIKHAIKLKTSPARLAQLLQPSIAALKAFENLLISVVPWFKQPDWTVRRHWLQAKTKC